ncbi:hypothetical protein CFOL_v3_00129 [Cephalotus follicularis]|uniref:Uncharacterized protein n=1 Tax=Cephalotus follicularis TaxID=3775 RepID=A0A1Q3ALF8_CEPFO|nr:hypothetical protein CFOL_v3_00129 [Cephalotus follicularis]
MGNDYLIVEENRNFTMLHNKKNGIRRSSSSSNLAGEEIEDLIGGTPGSLPDRLVSEMYIQMANKTSHGADRRRQRRKEKERQGRRKWETEHFVKIARCSPTPSRPLQGLWKGFCADMCLDFYFVAYDEIGGIICRRVGDLFSNCGAPVFWTSNATFIESPFPPEEEYIYDGRVHLRPSATENHIHGQQSATDIKLVSRILHITSSYELVIPGLAGTSVNPRLGEGRIWQYKNGTFGFGFLKDNFIIDLKCIVQDGCLLDTMELLCYDLN